MKRTCLAASASLLTLAGPIAAQVQIIGFSQSMEGGSHVGSLNGTHMLQLPGFDPRWGQLLEVTASGGIAHGKQFSASWSTACGCAAAGSSYYQDIWISTQFRLDMLPAVGTGSHSIAVTSESDQDRIGLTAPCPGDLELRTLNVHASDSDRIAAGVPGFFRPERWRVRIISGGSFSGPRPSSCFNSGTTVFETHAGFACNYIFDPSFQSTAIQGALPNSTGNPGELKIFGSNEVDANGLFVEVEQLPANAAGFMLMSRTTGSMMLGGGSQGLLLLGSPVYRVSGQLHQTDTNGQLSFQLDLGQIPVGANPLPGDTWHFQFWFRDANPSPTSNTTNATTVTFS